MGQNKGAGALFLVMGVFLACGLSTALNSVLIPYMHDRFQLPYAAAVCLETSFYLAYFLCSPLAGMAFPQKDYVKGITYGLLCGTIGSILLAFCGLSFHFIFVLLAVFILGGGIATIQVTANPYAMLIGDPESAASRLCIGQACTAVGTLLAPLLGGLILAPLGGLQPLLIPYTLLGLLWALLLFFSMMGSLPEGEHSVGEKEKEERVSPTKDPTLLLGLCAMTVFLGGDAATVSFLIPYLSDAKTLGIGLESAVKLSMLYWLGLFVGRLLGSYVILRFIKAEFLLAIHLFIVISLSTFVALSGGQTAAVAILSMGFFQSILFPTLFSLTLERCSCSKSLASGVLCMTNIGGALVPLAQGVIADRMGVPFSFVLPASCYLLCFFFFGLMIQYADGYRGGVLEARPGSIV